MAKLRYVKTLEQVKAAAEANPEFLRSTVTSLRCAYETDPAIAAALLPKPLEPAARPEVCVTCSHVAMHLSPDFTLEIGSAIFGVRARYAGEEGIYLVTMPMTTEQAVIGGRETYGEPKKIAKIDFALAGPEVSAVVTRMGVPYLELRGRLGTELPPRSFTEYGFCFKALPSCEQGAGFDGDPTLVRLEWQHEHERVRVLDDAQVILRESPFDPVVDVPVRRIVRMEYEVGTTRSNGKVLRTIPGEWLAPFLHQRYDDSSGTGIEIPD
jgi:acetoacetate decarboxylase